MSSVQLTFWQKQFFWCKKRWSFRKSTLERALKTKIEEKMRKTGKFGDHISRNTTPTTRHCFNDLTIRFYASKYPRTHIFTVSNLHWIVRPRFVSKWAFKLQAVEKSIILTFVKIPSSSVHGWPRATIVPNIIEIGEPRCRGHKENTKTVGGGSVMLEKVCRCGTWKCIDMWAQMTDIG